MKSVFFHFCLFFCLLLSAAEKMPALEKWIGDKGEIFESVDSDRFLSSRTGVERPYFQWTSEKKTEARYPGYSNSPALVFGGYKVPEVILTFDGKELSRLMISIYNRGDMGEIQPDDFAQRLENLSSYFTDLTGEKGRESKTDMGKSMLYQKSWVLSDNLIILLRYSSTGKGKKLQAEYIQVSYERTDDGKKQSQKGIAQIAGKGKNVSSAMLVENVKKDRNNTVYIDNVPMVDQGDKGYCAVAVAERLMRYYGNQVINQHTIAQMAETTERGTTTEKMIKAMKRIAGKCGFRFKVKYELTFESVKDFEKYVKQYNSTAKKMRKSKVETVIQGNMILANETMEQMDPDVIRAVRLANRTGMGKFLKNIKTSVDKGVPLIWGVEMGLLKEKGVPQRSGGHIRLIIGYNETEKTLIYSDSWGKGHEKKKMSFDDAWSITHALMILEP